MSANVLLEIQTAANIVALDVVINKVGQVASSVKNFVIEQDKFAKAWRNATIDITEADNATGGLIDTTKLFSSTIKLTNAQVGATAHDYRLLAAAGAEMGKSTGNYTEEFERLVEAAARGSSRGFKPLGISIKQTGDRARDFRSVMDQLESRFGNATYKAQDFTDALYVVNNDIGTLTGSIWGSVSKSRPGDGSLGSAFDNLHNSMGKAAKVFQEDTHIYMLAAIMDFETIAQVIVEAQKVITEGLGSLLMGGPGAFLDTVGKGQDRITAFLAGRASYIKKKSDKEFDTYGPEYLPGSIRKPGTGAKKENTGIQMDPFVMIEESPQLAITSPMEADLGNLPGLERKYEESLTEERIAKETEAQKYKIEIWKEGIDLQLRELELMQQRQQSIVADGQIAQGWRDTWNTAFDGFNVGAFGATTSINAVSGGMELLITQMFEDASKIGPALFMYLKQVMIQSAAQIFASAAVTYVKGLQYLASPYTAELAGPVFANASTQVGIGSVVLAASAGLHAVDKIFGIGKQLGAKAGEQVASSSANTMSQSAAGTGLPADTTRPTKVEITVDYKGGTASIVDVLIDENRNASRAGKRSFAEAGR